MGEINTFGSLTQLGKLATQCSHRRREAFQIEAFCGTHMLQDALILVGKVHNHNTRLHDALRLIDFTPAWKDSDFKVSTYREH